MFVDQNSDKTFVVLNEILQERPGLAPLVKTAEVGEEIRESLPASSFADPTNRAYPVHTPANAVLSKAYAIKQADVSQFVHARIDKALAIYGTELPPVMYEKTASVEETTYLLPSTKQFPIRSDGEVKLAEQALLSNAKKLKTSTLAVAALTLIKEASERGLEVSPRTLSLAGMTMCDRDKAAEYVEARASAAPEASDQFSKLAETLRGMPSGTSREDLIKVAEAVDSLDETYGLQRHYGISLPNSLETVFNTKVAMGATVDLAGAQITREQLSRFPVDFYADALGEDLAEEITGPEGDLDVDTAMVILETLPRDMKVTLRKLMGF